MDLYQYRIVFFFDILGFRDLVDKEYQNNQDNCTNILNIFKFIRKFYEDEITEKYVKSKEITFFSDSVIISFEEQEEDQFFKTLFDLQILILRLVKRNILIRGSISYGKLFHDDDFILGPAFIDAYDLETKKAIVPRIICDKDIILQAHKNKDNNSFQQDLPYLLELFDIDIDGQLYVDYYDKLRGVFDDDKQYFEYMVSLKNIIAATLNTSTSHNIRSKYLWMREKFNKSVVKNFSKSIGVSHDLMTLFSQVTVID